MFLLKNLLYEDDKFKHKNWKKPSPQRGQHFGNIFWCKFIHCEKGGELKSTTNDQIYHLLHSHNIQIDTSANKKIAKPLDPNLNDEQADGDVKQT